jgi:4-hydroxyphenylpyruvate dioxygenase
MASCSALRSCRPSRASGCCHRAASWPAPAARCTWQLIEPAPDAIDIDPEELLQRVAFGTPDVLASVAVLKSRGVDFVESPSGVHSGSRGALTRPSDTGPTFEFVHDPR